MEDIESVMKYFGLESQEEAEKISWILEELHTNYGSWGDKVASYLSGLLSGTPGTRTLISPSQMKTYKSLFSDYGRQERRTEEGRSQE